MAAMEDPVLVAHGEAGERLLERLLDRHVLAIAYVPETDAAMIQLDSDVAVYFRVTNGALTIEVEAPTMQ